MMTDWSPEELLAIAEAAEIVVQTLDRPEPGAAHMLTTIMAKAMAARTAAMAAETRCAFCGDLIHPGCDRDGKPSAQLYDSSGDPACWGRDGGAHDATDLEYPEALPRGSSVDAYATKIMAWVAEEQEGETPVGFRQMPPDVPNFSALHDFRDANMYLIDAIGAPGMESGSEEAAELVNAVSSEVSVRLAASAERWRQFPCAFVPDPHIDGARSCIAHGSGMLEIGEACPRVSDALAHPVRRSA